LAQLNTFLDKMSSLEERSSGLNVQLQAEEKELQKRALQLQQWDKLVQTGAASLEEGLHMLQHHVKDLEGEKDRLLKTQGLSSHAHLLVAGQACPLCGASEHPQPLNSSDTEDSLRSLEEQLKKNVATLEVLRDGVHSKKLEEIQLANIQKNLADKKQELQRLCLDQEGLMQSLTDLGIADKKGLEERLESLNTHHQHWIRLHKELDGLPKRKGSRGGESLTKHFIAKSRSLFQNIYPRTGHT
jgi:exonuclease SbcC